MTELCKSTTRYIVRLICCLIISTYLLRFLAVKCLIFFFHCECAASYVWSLQSNFSSNERWMLNHLPSSIHCNQLEIQIRNNGPTMRAIKKSIANTIDEKQRLNIIRSRANHYDIHETHTKT